MPEPRHEHPRRNICRLDGHTDAVVRREPRKYFCCISDELPTGEEYTWSLGLGAVVADEVEEPLRFCRQVDEVPLHP